ncbi:MFS transporter [Actinomycetes bacterium KLBMP 9797]
MRDHKETLPATTHNGGVGVPTGPAGRSEPVALRRNRDFLLLWTGQAVSAMGSSMAAVIYPLLALAATSSATLAGLVGFVGMAVAVLLRLPAGVLADRYPLKPLMITSDLIRTATTASIVITVAADRVTVAHLLAAAVLNAAAGTVFDSAQAVAVRHVVPSGHLPRALAQNEARGHIAILAGRPAGGYLYGISAALPVLADALSFLTSAALIYPVRNPLHDRQDRRTRGPIWRDIPTGLRHVWHSAFLRTTLLCAAGINTVFAGLSLIVIVTQTANGTAAAGIGAVFSIGAIGGILGAWASAPIHRLLSPSRLIYAFGWIATLALTALSQTHNSYAVGLLLAVVFFAAAPANAMLFAAQIDITPPELQGRVISATMLTAGIAAPLGPLLGGLLLDHAGHAPTFLAFSALVAVLTVTMHFSTAIRTMRTPGEN